MKGDSPSRDNRIIIYQNTETSKKIILGCHKIKEPQKHIHVTASFSTRKPEIDLLTLRNHNKTWLQFSKIE